MNLFSPNTFIIIVYFGGIVIVIVIEVRGLKFVLGLLGKLTFYHRTLTCVTKLEPNLDIPKIPTNIYVRVSCILLVVLLLHNLKKKEANVWQYFHCKSCVCNISMEIQIGGYL